MPTRERIEAATPLCQKAGCPELLRYDAGANSWRCPNPRHPVLTGERVIEVRATLREAARAA